MAKKSVTKKIEEFNTAILVPLTVYSDIDFSQAMVLDKEQFLEACYYVMSGTVPLDAIESVTGDSDDYKRLELWQEKWPVGEDAKMFCRLNMLYKKGSAILQGHLYQLALSGEKAQQIPAARLLLDMKEKHDKERRAKLNREIPF